MIGPGEALFRIAVPAEEIRLPRTIGSDARYFVDFGLIGDRVGGVGRALREQKIDLVVQDQFGRDLGGAGAARLTVLGDDLNLIGLAADRQALGQDALHLVENETVRLTKAGERAGMRANEAELN